MESGINQMQRGRATHAGMRFIEDDGVCRLAAGSQWVMYSYTDTIGLACHRRASGSPMMTTRCFLSSLSSLQTEIAQLAIRIDHITYTQSVNIAHYTYPVSYGIIPTRQSPLIEMSPPEIS